ncbi:MAG TPA: NUDIX hydrolase [Rhodanobacteraceae bacterium]|nr:NUDIX hydrolase [Rhodanobacteraceae bacterium]
MPVTMEPNWLQWAKELQAIAQIGLAYPSGDHFDAERYARIREIAAEIMGAAGAIDPGQLLGLFQRETGYATPKVDVRGAVISGDRILLVREREDGRWTLPGGWADVNETPGESVVREVREESGYRVVATRLAAAYDRSRRGHLPAFPFHVYKLFFICDVVDGKAAPSAETSEVRFFEEGALPALSESRVTAWEIARMFVHARNPRLTTEFD